MKKIARKFYNAARRAVGWFKVAAHRREVYDYLGYAGTAAIALGWLTSTEVTRILSTVAGVLLVSGTKLAKANAPDSLDTK